MNWTLLRSPWAVASTILIAGGFLGWWLVTGIDAGRGPGGDLSYLLWSGWIALLLYVVVIAYVGRKYVHRLRRAMPRAKVAPLAQSVEQATLDLQEVEAQILSGTLSSEKDVVARVKSVIASRGVKKLLRVDVSAGTGEGPAFLLDVRSPEPARRVLVWLHAHLYLGLGAALLVGLHGGMVWHTPMGLLLNGLSLVVTVTGVIGIWFWGVGPARLARAERNMSLEEAHSLEEHFGRKVHGLLAEPQKDPALETDKAYDKAKPVWDELRELAPLARRFRERLPTKEDVAAELARVKSEDAKIAHLQRDLLVLMFQHERARSEYTRLSRLKMWMSAWRILHIPVSIVLVALVTFHVLTVWWY